MKMWRKWTKLRRKRSWQDLKKKEKKSFVRQRYKFAVKKNKFLHIWNKDLPMPISSISINLGSTIVSLLFSTRNNLPKCSTVCCWEKGIQNRIHTRVTIGQTLCKYLKCYFTLILIWVDVPGFMKKGIFYSRTNNFYL